MRKAIGIVAILVLVAGVWGLSSALGAEAVKVEAEPAPAAKPKAEPIKVVILVGGHGYDKKTFPKAWDGHDDIKCEVWKGKPYTVFDDIAEFKYDVIIMFNMSGGMTDKQKANFLKLLKKGVGLVVWHHALANCQDWPQFEKIAGCKFWLKAGQRDGKKIGKSAAGHGPGMMKMHIADPKHPITKGMKDFEIKDEWYGKQTFIKGINVLVTTDEPKSDKNIAWTHKYSGARVFGYQSGHDVKAWANPGHRQLLGNGIRWVAGRLGKTAGPKPGEVDRTDPKSVAMAWLLAVANKDFEKAASCVIAREREGFRKDMKRRPIRGIPKHPELRVEVVKVRGGVKRTEAHVTNSKGNDIDMEFADGQWWVTK